MDVILFLLFFTFLSVLLDVYFFQILKNVIKLNTHFSKYILFFYWFFTFITIANFLLFAFDISIGYYPRTIVFNIIIGNFFCKLISLPFILVDDLRRLICYFFKLENNKDCMKDICYINTKGQERKINKTSIANIVKFLLKK